MDRILIILKKENGPRALSAPALGLNTIIFKYVYWYMKQISGERLQDHWSSGFIRLVISKYALKNTGLDSSVYMYSQKIPKLRTRCTKLYQDFNFFPGEHAPGHPLAT